MNRRTIMAISRILASGPKGILCALLLFALIAAALFFEARGSVNRLAVSEDGYVEIGNNKMRTYYLLVSSVEKKNQDGNEYIIGSVKTIYKKPEKLAPIDGKEPSYTIELWAANPKAKQTIHLSGAVYDKDHNMLRSDPFPSGTDRWQDCQPNSVGELCWEAIIDTYNKSHK